jgi:hypothetical protein
MNYFWSIMLGLFSASQAFAHHSFSAEFDNERPVSLEGTVIKMNWSNPHGWIYLAVKSEDGSVTEWALETSAANNLIRRGWRKHDLDEGTYLKVDGWQARNGTPTANIRSVMLADGRRLFAGTSNQSSENE